MKKNTLKTRAMISSIMMIPQPVETDTITMLLSKSWLTLIDCGGVVVFIDVDRLWWCFCFYLRLTIVSFSALVTPSATIGKGS